MVERSTDYFFDLATDYKETIITKCQLCYYTRITRIEPSTTHHSGTQYVVQAITNIDCGEKFPETVVYARLGDGKLFSRPKSEFLDKFITLKE